METVDYIISQATGATPITARKMFGEYALYADGKLVAVICDDQLYIKPTTAGRAYIGDVEEAQPYKGARPSFHIPNDRLEDGDWLAGLIARTADALPTPIAKPRKAAKRQPRKRSKL